MKRFMKIFALSLALLMAFTLCACGGGGELGGEVDTSAADVTINVTAGSATKTGLEYTLELSGTAEFSCDTGSYYLEHNVGGMWNRVTKVGDQAAGESIAWSDANSQSFTVDWSSIYGELEGGLYKIYLPVTLNGESKIISADFEISTVEME